MHFGDKAGLRKPIKAVMNITETDLDKEAYRRNHGRN